MRCIVDWLETFQSTLPARGATLSGSDGAPSPKISIHAPRTGSDPCPPYPDNQQWQISIHAPRTGSDVICYTTKPVETHFNPRSPHGERLNCFRYRPCIDTFQSTLPARGATDACFACAHSIRISIHAPRTGSDAVRVGHLLRRDAISIHAPRTGSDAQVQHSPFDAADFNPRSPHGERQLHLLPPSAAVNFNPRSPHGERRVSPFASPLLHRISIHAPRTGSDACSLAVRSS